MLHEASPGRRPATDEPLHVLLVEDDDGDAFLVEELLAEADLHPDLTRAWSLEAALDALAVPVDCVLLDLGLPDASGLDALVRLREVSDAALVVLTGLDDAERGVAAVAAGAQDYLVKGTVDGELLGRAVRYAVERRRAEQERRVHERTRHRAEQTSRLERSLLAEPHLPDAAVRVTVRYDASGEGILGSDLYDVVQRPDGSVAALLGDVSGTGPDAAALGTSLRISWRALVLAGLPAGDILRSLDGILRAEQPEPAFFATAVMVELDADRRSCRVYLAGHPGPLMLGPQGAEPVPTDARGPALGVVEDGAWPAAELGLPPGGRLLLFSDGLINVRPQGGEPLGTRRLLDLLTEAAGVAADDAGLVDSLVRAARRYGADAPGDDVALVLLSWDGR